MSGMDMIVIPFFNVWLFRRSLHDMQKPILQKQVCIGTVICIKTIVGWRIYLLGSFGGHR